MIGLLIPFDDRSRKGVISCLERSDGIRNHTFGKATQIGEARGQLIQVTIVPADNMIGQAVHTNGPRQGCREICKPLILKDYSMGEVRDKFVKET
ncbi:hypothetical protein GCM10007853_08350 [Algimonas ampicilliniresistens]|uniref:Uncharacterized protein n=1 Tax=Algimonas ampicilliniresistens TaxID=1298735 RepID=A0ABQ5V609_9PROT|nr:hypothetical protein GCM10007853_08350 [Algimonas ampicilliniresistens]